MPVAELLYTERAHMRNLKVMQKIFMIPMMTDTSISYDLVKLLFPNIDDMIQVHGEFCLACGHAGKLSCESWNLFISNFRDFHSFWQPQENILWWKETDFDIIII